LRRQTNTAGAPSGTIVVGCYVWTAVVLRGGHSLALCERWCVPAGFDAELHVRRFRGTVLDDDFPMLKGVSTGISRLTRAAALFALAALLATTLARGVHGQQDDPGAPRNVAPLTILQINDVYSTIPVNGVGGLARVATLKKNIAASGRTPLMMLAGD